MKQFPSTPPLLAGIGLALLWSALLAAPAGAIWPFSGGGYPDPEDDLGGAAAGILSRAIQFDTTSPPGNERPLAEFLVGVLSRKGLEARVVPTPDRDAPEGRAAAWGRYKGEGRKRPIVLLSHLDVVPADSEQWAVDPFGGVVGGGYVVGRGALDAKGVSVVHLLTLVELAQRKVRLDRDVIFLATPDEEVGGRNGAGYVLREQRNLLHDAEYLLTEGGAILPGRGPGAVDVWGVTFVEKSPCWIEVVARGTPGHGSAAARDAAVPRLISALERLGRFETPIRVVPEVATMFAALAPFAPPADRPGLRELETSLREDPEFRERFLAEPGRNALVRNTLTVTVLQGSERTNMVPAEARAQLDARLLPGESCTAFIEQVRARIADPGIALEAILSFETLASPVDTDLFRAISRVAEGSGRPAVVVPRVIGGFTDAHYFRDVGIVAYGFVPRWLQPHETRGIHGPNERISVENLEKGVRTMVRIIEELAGTPEP